MPRLTTNMPIISCLSFLVAVHLAACSSQSPNVTRCPRSDLSIIDIDSVIIDNAELGQEVAVDVRIQVLRSFGSYPVLEIYVNTTKGKQLECFYSYLPKEARLCYVTTAVEAKLGSEWNNSCPISPGGYIAHLAFKLPNVPSAESCIGNGDLVFTLKIRDEGYVLDCVTFPVKIDRR